MLADNILSAVKDDSWRLKILNHICSLEHSISSIYTCIENTKWLESDVRILKKLLSNNSKDSILQQFCTLHNKQVNMKIQISEFIFENWMLSFSNSFWLLYWQIFLFSLCHFSVMGSQTLQKDTVRQSSLHSEIQQWWWYKLSSLTLESRYSELHQKYWAYETADVKAIKNCVYNILSSKYYWINVTHMH